MSTFALGGLLAICNCAFNATALGLTSPIARGHHHIDVAVAVMFVSTLPAIVLGLCLAGVANRIAMARPWRRVLLLSPPAIGVVGALGYLFESKSYIVLASIPTLVCVAILERASRRSELESIPLAVASKVQ